MTDDPYFGELIHAAERVDLGAIEAAAALIYRSWELGGRCVLFGNGGSMATASHLACDLAKWSESEDGSVFRGVRAVALDSLPLLTAYANDEGYGTIFGRALRSVLEHRDVAIGISCSGRSPNVLAGLIAARRAGADTILMTGRSIPVGALVDVVLAVEADDIRVQEAMHLAVGQYLAGRLRSMIEEGQ